MSEHQQQLTRIVEEWRAVSDIKDKREKTRNAARARRIQLQEEHSAMLTEWEAEKLLAESTLEAVGQEVEGKKQLLAAVERDIMALSAKVHERQIKVDEYKRVIQGREETVDLNFKEVMAKEHADKNRLLEFRDARDVAQNKLKKTLEQLQASIPKENALHQERLNTIAEKTKEMESKIALEAEQWEQECARREYESLTSAQQSLESEVQECNVTKNQWSETLSALSSQSQRSVSILNELSQLRQMLRPQS